ncbi:MAG: magnesium chelatase ATPase subunit I, partial [Cetobacterium sp.]
LLSEVVYSEEMLELVAKIGISLGVDGHRCDLSIIKTAMTIAAFDRKKEVEKDHILRAAVLAVPHRMRKTPFSDNEFSIEAIENIINSIGG